jgi:hypothetical protein
MEQPITRADLEAVFTSFAEHFDKRLDALSEDVALLKAETERSKTSLLTEFHKWARTHEVRTRAVSGTVVGFDERLMIMEDRLSEVERKLLLK